MQVAPLTQGLSLQVVALFLHSGPLYPGPQSHLLRSELQVPPGEGRGVNSRSWGGLNPDQGKGLIPDPGGVNSRSREGVRGGLTPD